MSAYTHRRAVAGDRAFIIRSWVESYKYSAWAGNLPNDLYFASYPTAIERLLDDVAVEVWISSSSEEDAAHDIRGFAVVERGKVPIAHYVYVKQAFRGFGVARALLAAAGVDIERRFVITYRNEDVDEYMKRRREQGRPLHLSHVPKLTRLPKARTP